ncbi:STAS domain-containing protein [Spiribacter halobius]|uniref:STAS domain-containing protein n=1 Tax=Sediminicurvatus halobius TaxID=2182432 RepID=A0A2U2N4L6_9GAMM|nr:STAS domain-containing protein [Spiribacter halobius]PWG64136.1 hypothetical protein DEM34_06460 [Spiribacter halobius]UEX78742.1 STAS domain-containing protein [Spiribacter halobius]
MAEADITLESRVDVTLAAELRSTLDMALSGEGTLSVDAAAVEQVDTAGIQLLLALRQEAERRGRAFAWQAASPALQDTARRLGLEAQLGLPPAAVSTED